MRALGLTAREDFWAGTLEVTADISDEAKAPPARPLRSGAPELDLQGRLTGRPLSVRRSTLAARHRPGEGPSALHNVLEEMSAGA